MSGIILIKNYGRWPILCVWTLIDVIVGVSAAGYQLFQTLSQYLAPGRAFTAGATFS